MRRILAAVLAAIVLAGCGNVPLTGRKQILLVSDQEVYQAGLVQYDEYIKGRPCLLIQARQGWSGQWDRNLLRLQKSI